MPGDGEMRDQVTAPHRQQDGDSAHGWRTALALVGLRSLLPDLLPEALPGEQPDQVGREQDGGQQGNPGGDQDGAHSALRWSRPFRESGAASSPSAMRSNPTARDALISTTSPGASSSCRSSSAAGTSGTSTECGIG